MLNQTAEAPVFPSMANVLQTARTDVVQPASVDLYQTARTDVFQPSSVDLYQTARDLPFLSPGQQITPVLSVTDYISPVGSTITELEPSSSGLDSDLLTLAASTGDSIIDHSPIVQQSQPDVIPSTPGASPTKAPISGEDPPLPARDHSPTPEPISRAQTSTARSLFQRHPGSPDLFEDEDDIIPLSPSPVRPCGSKRKAEGERVQQPADISGVDFSSISVPTTPMILGRKKNKTPVRGWSNQYSDRPEQVAASSENTSRRGRPTKRRGRAHSLGKNSIFF